jgi:hypothetical protein
MISNGMKRRSLLSVGALTLANCDTLTAEDPDPIRGPQRKSVLKSASTVGKQLLRLFRRRIISKKANGGLRIRLTRS